MHHDRQGGGYCDGWQKIWTVVEVAWSKGHKWMMLIHGRDSAHNLSLKLSPYLSSWKMTVFSLHVLHEISGVLLLWFSSTICLVTTTLLAVAQTTDHFMGQSNLWQFFQWAMILWAVDLEGRDWRKEGKRGGVWSMEDEWKRRREGDEEGRWGREGGGDIVRS